MTIAMKKLRNWLHIKGIARYINGYWSSYGDDWVTFEVRGPWFVARALAVNTLKHGETKIDWLSISIRKTRQAGFWHYYITLNYRRL